MFIRNATFATGLVLLLAFSGYNPAQDPQASAFERQFMSYAAQTNLADINMARLAFDHSQNPAVHPFARTLEIDHKEADKELADLAASKDIIFPSGMDARHKAVRARLARLHGRDFDSEFLVRMVGDRVTALSQFERASQLAIDEDVRGYATKMQPLLAEHLKRARELADQYRSPQVTDKAY